MRRERVQIVGQASEDDQEEVQHDGEYYQSRRLNQSEGISVETNMENDGIFCVATCILISKFEIMHK